jgi:hypothetical protein
VSLLIKTLVKSLYFGSRVLSIESTEISRLTLFIVLGSLGYQIVSNVYITWYTGSIYICLYCVPANYRYLITGYLGVLKCPHQTEPRLYFIEREYEEGVWWGQSK